MNTILRKQGDQESIPRAVIVDLSDNFGGANARVLALMQNFPREYIGLATITGSAIAADLEKAGYTVHYVAQNKFDPRIPFRMARIIRAHGYQIVDTQNPQSKLWGSFAALMERVALVSTLNSWYMNEHPKYSLRWFVYSGIELFTNFALARYIVVSREIQDAMVRVGIPRYRIDLIHNAVDLDASKIVGEKKWLLEKYCLPKDAIVCLAAGRLTWAKGHDDLICAIRKAREQNPNLYCLIAGEGTLQKKLIGQIKQMNMEETIILIGHLNHKELLSVLKACDIYVMSSRTEGTPVALLEAAALGKPIVASEVGGIPELVMDEVHALLFDVGDVDGLASALLRVAWDVNLAHRLGQEAKKRVDTHFSLAVQAQATIETYIKARK